MIEIKGGHIVDPVSKTDEIMDILIDGCKIMKVDKNIEPESGTEVVDADGLIVAPGIVDAHVHFRDPGFTYKEDIDTGAMAAAAGGVTTVICMANTKPPVDNIDTLRYIIDKGKKTGIRIYQTANVTKGMKGEETVDFDEMAAAGAAGFTDDGVPVMDAKLLLKAMKSVEKLGLPISLHEESPEFIEKPGVNMGDVSEKLGYGGASHLAEDIMVARDAVLALETGAKVVIQHISSGKSVEIVRAFKKMGANLYAEATPHHFTLTEEAVLKYGTNVRINPPVRTENDRQLIIEGLADGTIDMIVTDHAPHSSDEKKKTLEKAPSGIIGLETSLALGIRELVQPGRISLMKLIELMSTNPARLYNLTPGSVTAGAAADLVIFGENEKFRVENFKSKASNSPFLGWTLPGKIHMTICNGKVIYKN